MLELEHGFRIVDTHLVVEPDANRRGDASGDPEMIERELHQAGVVKAIAYPAERDGSYLKANNAVARMAVERPFTAAARINGALVPQTGPTASVLNVARSRGNDHTSPEDIEQFAYEDRFVAFMTNPATDGVPDAAVLEKLESVGLPLITYGGVEFTPAQIESTFLQYDFPVVIAHCGGYPLNRELMDETIGLLSRYEACYVDTSFVRFRDPLERAILEHPDRVLFGSGAPSVHPDVAVMEILTLNIPEDAMRRVFSNNASRIIDELAP